MTHSIKVQQTNWRSKVKAWEGLESHLNEDNKTNYEGKRKKLARQQIWGLKCKKRRTDKGKRRSHIPLKCTDLIKDGLKMSNFIMFLILILVVSVLIHCRNRSGHILVIKDVGYNLRFQVAKLSTKKIVPGTSDKGLRNKERKLPNTTKVLPAEQFRQCLSWPTTSNNF